MFKDRTDAGRQLAAAVAALGAIDPIVLALPRGGAPVALEIARALHAPLDLLFVRKLGAPGDPELAIGAIIDGPAPHVWLNEELIARLGAPRAYIEALTAQARDEIARRRALYLPGRAPLSLEGRTLILVDDGLATGASQRAAIAAVKGQRPRRVIVAVPVAAADSADEIGALVDDFICLERPRVFRAVGEHYEDFHQLTDEEVIALLADAAL